MTKEKPVDELKLLGLLWRESTASPRSGISTSIVTAGAVELADREGLQAVTIRRLAQESGVTAMALYPHIGGRPELVELMRDHVAASTYATAGSLDSSEWRERIEAVAEANWRVCQNHPWILEITAGRPVPGPGASAKYEIELSALEGIGLSDLQMEHALAALLSLVQGTARDAIAISRSRDPGETQDVAWWARIEPAFQTMIGDSSRYPIASRVSRTLGESTGKASDPDGAYRFGLNLLLNGIAKQIDHLNG